jgi:hypothetical protein
MQGPSEKSKLQGPSEKNKLQGPSENSKLQGQYSGWAHNFTQEKIREAPIFAIINHVAL